jgi:hypothetical protein
MKKNSNFLKILSVVQCGSLVLSLGCTGVSAAENVTDTDAFAEYIASVFEDPDIDYRPEIRWWLAEGSHTDETLLESIQTLYDAGFGAIEFVTLDESEYLDDATYSWGSEEWIHDSHLIVQRCTELGMGVSFTSGTHWSNANLPSITPDEESAAQELGYQTISLGAGETYDDVLPTPQLTSDATKLSLVRVIAAKATETSETGATLDPDSLTDITESVEEKDGNWYLNYTAPADGDTLIFGFWQYGTSESAVPSIGTNYTINYFSEEGANALIEYWDEHVLDDEMKEWIQENGDVSMYMDSLELSTAGENSTGWLWCSDFLEEFQNRRGYDLSLYLPLICKSSSGFEALAYYYDLDGEEELTTNLRNDLMQTMTELYMEECLDVLGEYLHSFGMTLRAENSYGISGLEISQPITSLDYVETESLEWVTELEGFRTQSGTARLYNIPFSSETGAVMGENYYLDNDYYRQIFYTQFASGVQRTVLHGYASAYGPEETVYWPGYEGMMPMFSERFCERQPAFSDYKDMTDHLSRIQTALRQGTAQMDIAILRNDYAVNNSICFALSGDYYDNYLHRNEGYYWTDMTLQNNGYTYDYFSQYLLQDESLTVTNNVLQEDGGAYQAMIVYQDTMPYESAVRLLEMAQEGLPVVIVDGASEMVRNDVWVTYEKAASTTGANDGKDEELNEIMDQVRALDNVVVINDEADAYDALLSLGVRPRAEYTEENSNLLSVLRKDENASYLYVYNYMYEEEENYTGQISVDGIYSPYVINTWDGSTEKLLDCTYDNGRTILSVDLAPGDIVLFALNPEENTNPVTSSSDNVTKVVLENGQPVIYVSESGTADIVYADGTEYSTEVSVDDNISLDTWNLTVDSWEPGEKVERTEDRGLGYTTTEVTYETNIVTKEVGETALIPWQDIEAVGDTVSGIGYYTTEFTLADDWDDTTDGLTLNIESLCGGTASLYVNDEKVSLDWNDGTVDLSAYVHAGTNTIEVQVSSSLRNRMKAEGYEGNWQITLDPEVPAANTADYGMVGTVELQTYTKVAVSAE